METRDQRQHERKRREEKRRKIPVSKRARGLPPAPPTGRQRVGLRRGERVELWASGSELELRVGRGSGGGEQRCVRHPVGRVVAHDSHSARMDTRNARRFNGHCASNTATGSCTDFMPASRCWLGSTISIAAHVFSSENILLTNYSYLKSL